MFTKSKLTEMKTRQLVLYAILAIAAIFLIMKLLKKEEYQYDMKLPTCTKCIADLTKSKIDEVWRTVPTRPKPMWGEGAVIDTRSDAQWVNDVFNAYHKAGIEPSCQNKGQCGGVQPNNSVKPGGKCLTDQECMSGICTTGNVCREPAPAPGSVKYGGKCFNDVDCDYGTCKNNKCVRDKITKTSERTFFQFL